MSAPTAVRELVRVLESSYKVGDWNALRSLFSGSSLRKAWLPRFKSWKDQGVSLRVGVVYVEHSPASKYIATLQFSGDPRATSRYQTFEVRKHGRAVEVTKEVTGITGGNWQDASWAITHSAHFTIYHSPFQLHGQDRRALQDLEHQRSLFQQKFGVRVAGRIAYYLYPDHPSMNRLTADSCGSSPDVVGCAAPYAHPPRIQSAGLWPTYHEPIHVYELTLQPKPTARGVYYLEPLFIAEGTAVALEERDLNPRHSDYCSTLRYLPLDQCARSVVKHVSPLTILSDRAFRSRGGGPGYALGGSFVKYLILRKGYRQFGHFYYTLAAQPKDRLRDYDAAARQVYRVSFLRLLAQWRNSLCRRGC